MFREKYFLGRPWEPEKERRERERKREERKNTESRFWGGDLINSVVNYQFHSNKLDGRI